MAKIVFVDTETGGSRPETHSLLTIGLVTLNTRSLDVTTPLLIRVKHEVYHVNAEAMEVNGIDLKEHHALAVAPEEAAEAVRVYLRGDKGRRVMIGGHNVAFDERFLRALVPDWRSLVLGATVDTKATAQFLLHAGALSNVGGTRLEDLAARFDIPLRPHDALEDAVATARVYAAFLELLRSSAVAGG
ncbi:exonuclease domain-containing protein [Deinococcus yavapaiensis]|uniref:DNA polymerase-3 subunit epsilon/ribonuclease T n=1 Tax=Deinococcus yavapaiensis KR-236 TaxID=694435 RepID=A0A318S356_9DEIO|nr:exonuclease domain-containing protein [Deinococcus yavapaiensis]PYE51855.1 DNA polymerase-3 subunit epsilon/ribonuclease T [Deinococcus yavapaiensis KR-236]